MNLARTFRFAIAIPLCATCLNGLAAPAATVGALTRQPAPSQARTSTAPPSPAAPQSVTPAAAAVIPAATENLTLYKGEIRMLPMGGPVRRVALGNGGVLTATTVEDAVMLIAEQEGDTSLVLWVGASLRQYKVKVVARDVDDTVEQLRPVLTGMPGVTLSRVGGKIILAGKTSPDVLDQLKSVIQGVPDVVNLVRTDDVMEQLGGILKGTPEVSVTRTGSQLILQGTTHADNLALIKTAVQGLPGVVNLVKQDEGEPLRKTVYFKLQLMELTKSAQEQIGIQWDKSFNGPQLAYQGAAAHRGAYDGGIPGATGASSAAGLYFGIATGIMSRVNAAVAKGDAYVLAAPELATKSGGKAEFLAGGEIPIPKAGALGAVDVEYKKYGMILHISPVIDANNNITAKIETELSHIDAGVTYGGFPGFLTRRTESEVSMRAGETMAISGLIDAETSKAGDSVPLLGSIPILGRLFRSDAFQHRRSDLVIFVTPEVYDPASAKNAELLARAAQIQQGEQAMSGEPSPQPPVGPTPAAPVLPVPPKAHDTRLQAAQSPARQETPTVPAAAKPALPVAAIGTQDAVAPAVVQPAIERAIALGLNQNRGEGTPRAYCWSCVTAGAQ